MKGHFVKPSWESSSFGLDERIMDRVPIGDLRVKFKVIEEAEYTIGNTPYT